MEMDYIYQGRILIVDLSKRETYEEEIEEDLVEKYWGGAGINVQLLRKHGLRDSLIIGTGPLTATFSPAGNLGTLTAISPLNGRLYHLPLTWQFAIEMKLSGFDFLVIKGGSSQPVRLWIRDEIADIDDSGDIWLKDTREAMATLREEYGDAMIQSLLIGPAGGKGLLHAQISENYWGSWDRFGFGAIFGRMMLKSICVRGLGSLEVAEGFFKHSMNLRASIITNKRRTGLKSLLDALGQADGGAGGWVAERGHRLSACFGCPFPCKEFVMLRDEPSIMKESEQEFPGILLNDPFSLLSFPFEEAQAGEDFEECLKLGLDPAWIGSLAQSRGKNSVNELRDIIREVMEGDVGDDIPHYNKVLPWPLTVGDEAGLIQAFGIFCPTPPPGPIFDTFSDLGIGEGAVERARWWIEINGLATVVGLCPMFLLAYPNMDPEAVSDCLSAALAGEGPSKEALMESVKAMIADCLDIEQAQRDIHPSLYKENLEEGLKELEEGFKKNV